MSKVEGQGSLRLMIAGGGTGGHVLPAVAVIEEIRRRGLDVEFVWIGSHAGVERSIAAANEIRFHAIQTGKLRRYISGKTVVDAFRIPIGTAQAWLHVRRFRPDVIYSTGGAVSVPSVVAGARSTPILTHEQTAQIGIANRTSARFADVFAVTFDDTAELARQIHKNVVVTGNPVRSSLTGGMAENAYARFGFTPDLPVLYVTGGARGASPINERLMPELPRLLQKMQIVHQVGPASANNDAATLRQLRSTWPDTLQRRYVVEEFIGAEIADLYAITDLVLGRAGAGTITELSFMGLPSILMPLPGTWGDEQRKNARVLANVNASVTLEQEDATPERLATEIEQLITNRERLD
ncbi:MAG TPA: UDP-N-acetylglucosamine--N-acetylmuramyl-(pentapeptide) pyrophosphoryl-undecaprenol N-acetylglucosamine transferase, partial [Thermomicrobiales bacterium]|nr:UDP-N-acetylglucosamine--N-acetylmuramyl-(pentapeptide) pyrophosphoryl-undecaprenol N-acetylglucosamine transferase [Thermomicrobiales bacterium]